MQTTFGADFEIEQQLERYAQVRLSPAPAASARMRARVMRETRLAIASGRVAAPSASSAPIALATTARRRALVRRAGGLVLAAALSLAVVGGALAAGQPGGPLYGSRIWIESLTLPVDAANRADAEIVRLEARLAEIGVAAGRGDADAIADALAAYASIADEALAAAADNPAALDRVRTALDRHLAVLGRVAGQVPSQAAAQIGANIERAIEHSNAAIDRIDSRPKPPSGKPASGGAAGPEATPKAETKTPKPDLSTPKPTSNPPAATPPAAESRPPAGPPSEKPGKTPPAHPDDDEQ